MSAQVGMRDGQVVVLVQERRKLLRDGLALLLDATGDVHVAATAETGPELVDLAEKVPCHVVALELRADAWDVSEVVAAVTMARPGVRFAGLHPGRRSDQLELAQRVGIDSLVSYDVGITAASATLRGAALEPVDPSVERRRLGPRLLTEREREVLGHISAGLTTAESATALRLSAKTVEHHRRRIFSKLGVQNQAHAVAVAHQLGLLRSAPHNDA